MKLAAAGLAALVSTSALAQSQVFRSASGDLNVETVASGLVQPMGARLPARRPHAGHRTAGTAAHRHARRQIVAAGRRPAAESSRADRADCSTSSLDRNYAQNRTIYFCFADPADGGGRTAMARARLDDGAKPQLEELRIIFRQEGPLSSGNHYRLPHRADAGQQSLSHHGRSLRPARRGAESRAIISARSSASRPDGSVPPDNPFVNRQDAKPEIWSYGHRNSQGRRDQSRERKILDARARPARRRRDQHSGSRKELRLAGDRLRHRLQRGEDPRGHAQGRDGAADLPMDAGDRAIRHGVLWRRRCFRNGRATCSSADSPPASWCGSNSTARRSPGKSGCCGDLSERIRDVRNGPDGALWLVTDNAAGRVLRVTPAK